MRIPQDSKPLTVLVAVVMAWTALAIVLFGFGDRGIFGYVLPYRLVLLVGLVALGLGMGWRPRWPVFAFALLTIGAVAPSVMYWALPLYAPIGVALIIVAFNTTLRAPRAQDTVSI